MEEQKLEVIKGLFEDRDWQEIEGYAEGTKAKMLRDDGYAKTMLLKLPKGFRADRHTHSTVEQFIVLKGEYASDDAAYPEGSYVMFDANEEHGPFEAKEETLILVIRDSKTY
ncbi:MULTISPECIES: cupin domain-containing protein [unclassified Saccharicrinis]|uniref:cupin domain-containing protein n=1 Tax=unclassified Saccharicrinis TaxID=2646859 RepID=UPI003D33A16A